MMKNTSSSLLSQLLVAVLFAALTILALAIFVKFAEPPERKPGVIFEQNYREQALTDQLTEKSFSEQLGRIKQASMPAGASEIGRMPGTPGSAATEQLITETFQQAGLTVYKQAVQVVVPKTKYCEILDANGKPLPGVRLYPFEPNGLLPNALPPDGVIGKLQILESGNPLDVVGKPLENSIVLDRRMDTAWPMLASMGVKAVIYQDNQLDEAAKQSPDSPLPWAGITTPFDVDYPFFYLRGSLDAYANQELTIRCKVTWETVTVNNVFGVLPGKDKANEALIINSYYDSYSVVPDIAPGAEQAISMAAMLQLVKAMAPYKGQMKRDVIFSAVSGHCESMAGCYALLEAIETFSQKYQSYRSFDRQIAEITSPNGLLTYARRGLAIINSDAPWQPGDNSAYQSVWNKEDGQFRNYFEKQFAQVAGEINLAVREDYIAARLAWLRAGRPTFREGFDVTTATDKERGDPSNQHPLMQAYIYKKYLDTRAANVIATPFWTIARQLGPDKDDAVGLYTKWGYRDALRRRFQELIDYHERQIASLKQSKVLREQVFNRYSNTLTVNLSLYSGGASQLKDLSVLAGLAQPGTVVEPQSTELKNALASYVPLKGEDPTLTVTSWGSADATGSPSDPGVADVRESQVWFKSGKLAYTIANKTFAPAKIGTPEDTFENINTGVVGQQLPIIGRALLSVAFGRVTFKTIKPLSNITDFVYSKGRVLTKVGTTTIVPTHPMVDKTFVKISTIVTPLVSGVRSFVLLPVDPYGQYEKKFYVIPLWSSVTADAARFDDNGKVQYYKDLSAASLAVSNSEGISAAMVAVGGGSSREMNISLFRSSMVSCFQRINPKTLNAFPAFSFLTNTGLAEPEASHYDTSGPAITAFLPPDTCFYIGAMDGSADNPAIQTYRAFLLNVDGLPEKIPAGEEEIYGKGYIAADAKNITFPYFDGAASMLRTNAKRLQLQSTYRMADEQMVKSQQLSGQLLAEARELRAKGDPFSAVNVAGKSFALAINNHPVIRNKISNAIFGILWYLAILVPFVFFMEKLLFGFADIRKQLLAVGIIFIVVFLLLKTFHPAFHMVRSPMMILLGFVIFLLSLVVAFMVSGKFQQVVKSLRRKEGSVEGADVNRGGVIGTAFMLGLNNMRRRKVRTGLTCVTLILITFVMICFTSVSTDLQNVEYITGRSPANGLIRRDPNFLPIADSELTNIKQIYGLDYPISVQSWLVGGADPASRKNTDITIDRDSVIDGKTVPHRANVNAAITMQADEPAFSGVDKYLITKKGWFPAPPDTKEAMDKAVAAGYKPQNYVILSDQAAEKLDISPEQVNNGSPTVMIRGIQFVVQGIFNSTRFDKHTGMDGQSMMPYDLSSQSQGKVAAQAAGANTSTSVQSRQVSSPQNIDRLPSSKVIIVSIALTPDSAKGEQFITVICSVRFPDKDYRLRSDLPVRHAVKISQQRAVVDEYLERLGIGAYYSIGNVAYYGYRTRMKTFTGLIELLIPILIAAMTVFNTMRGSVYERKDEIYVYNAVGIAPNHVFFMFMAEACVYAVIGAMAGYLLSQITGTVLTALHLTGGLNMDYSSIETIYASVAIVASVMLSTIIPARTASRLALPSDEVSWSVPKVDGDTLEFNLPFTFTAHDRIAVLSYFQRWLDANGEGSSGPFFCSPPHAVLERKEDEPNNHGLVPSIESTIWLKPYDVGVSQRLIIHLPTDPETGEYIARITIERLSGTMAAWTRALLPFLGTLRKQFLNWRAVSDEERAEMFEEAKTMLITTTEVERETAHA